MIATGTDPDSADVAGAKAGDVDAFRRLHQRHADRIYTLSRRIVGRTLADDAAQDIFIQVWEKLHQFRGDARFATWLHRVAVTMLLRQRDVARRIAARLSDVPLELLPSRASSGDARLDVEEALARLQPDVHDVVLLHDVEGYSHEEIAGVLGVSVSASKMRLHRGRMLLREWLAQ